MSDVKKKKGILAAILNSMKKTGGCCGPGESCCGPAKPKPAKDGAIPKPDGCGSGQKETLHK